MTAPSIAPEDILHFWVGAPGEPPLARVSSWWKKDAAFDREIVERFGAAIEQAAAGALASFRVTPRGRLALVILLDQLSRNAFRGTPRSFAQDPLALAVAEESFAAGDAATLGAVEVGLLLMPFMHAEDAALQRRCVDGFVALRDAATDEAVRAHLANCAVFADKHRVIVERFGRFPHRNAILGRTSTPEELAFLEQPGSSF